MPLFASIFTVLSLFCQQPQPALRLAVVGLSGDLDRSAYAVLTQGLTADTRVIIQDPARVKAAVAGFGYDGSINMTTLEARRLGAAIGCDYLVVGKTEALTRSEKAGESHIEAMIAVMIADGRSGALAMFDFIVEKAADRDAAERLARQALMNRAAGFVDRLIQAGASRGRRAAAPGPAEPVEEIPIDGTPQAVGFKPPEFLNRVKPVYTDQADLAGISATVEARVVFLQNGEIGEIEITRWAGFGLDEAAVAAIRQLRFKPATRDGRPFNARGEVRYNFNRR